jgi:nitrate reductase NapE component
MIYFGIYILIGIILAALVRAMDSFKEFSDNFYFFIVSLWPIALIIIIFAGIWEFLVWMFRKILEKTLDK